jgi:hypothetical protein
MNWPIFPRASTWPLPFLLANVTAVAGSMKEAKIPYPARKICHAIKSPICAKLKQTNTRLAAITALGNAADSLSTTSPFPIKASSMICLPGERLLET